MRMRRKGKLNEKSDDDNNRRGEPKKTKALEELMIDV
jgi:hypothetical protein